MVSYAVLLVEVMQIVEERIRSVRPHNEGDIHLKKSQARYEIGISNSSMIICQLGPGIEKIS